MTSIRADSSGKGGISYPVLLGPVAPPPLATPSRPQDPLLQRKYREVIRKHLDKHLDKLFAEFTGLHFHITWAPAPQHEWDTQTLPTACSVCCRLSGAPLLRDCRSCASRQLARVLGSDSSGHHFTCRLGVLNYWFRIHVRGATLGIAYLQALDCKPPPKAVQIHRHLPPRATKGKSLTPGNTRPCQDAKRMSWEEFDRAARLMHLIVQHAQTASLADLRKTDLTSAGRAVVALEKEQERLREALKLHLPAAPQTLRRYGSKSHPEQIVQRVLEFTEQNYGKPITLCRYARELGMNAAYLSNLFSQAVGVPFKTHLTELRMAKAKALLGDPAKSTSEVAYAVGYASENRFRIAFKNATGLSPRLWRETMQANPPLPRAST